MNDVTITIQDKFESTERTTADIHKAMSIHFSHHYICEEGCVDPSREGESVFNVTRKCARWLLHNCTHTVPEGAAGDTVFTFRAALEAEGVKHSWPAKAIVINTTTNTIESGAELLFGLAISDTFGTYLPIELTNNS